MVENNNWRCVLNNNGLVISQNKSQQKTERRATMSQNKGQSFLLNWVRRIFLNLVYKNDMCPLNM
jgi:hypothetical protein